MATDAADPTLRTEWTCPDCGRTRIWWGHVVASEAVCRGCWIDAREDRLLEEETDG